jgi:molecular chaperone GrpE
MTLMEIDTEKPPHAEARARLLSQFERWLDSALAEEAPPEGVTANLLTALDSGETLPPVEGSSDLYSLWSAMTALTQEVKIQSRTFRQLNDTLTTKLESMVQAAQGTPGAPPIAGEEGASHPVAGAEKKLEKNQLDLLLDLHDRLDRGLRSVRQAATQLRVVPRRSLLSRWLGAGKAELRQTQDTLTALEKGYTLTLQRVDQALEDSHLYPIHCAGQIFDPHRMTAVELEETDAVPEGTVVATYSDGYEWNGQLYRAAQVKVARPLANAGQENRKYSG